MGSRTAWNQDLLLGHTRSSSIPTTTRPAPPPTRERGKTYAQPTSPEGSWHRRRVQLESVNKQSGAVANLRDGGSGAAAIRGEAYAIVHANATAGTTNAGPGYLGPARATDESVPALEHRRHPPPLRDRA